MSYTDDDVATRTKGMTSEQVSKANLIANTLLAYPNLIIDMFGDQPPILTKDNVDDLYDNLRPRMKGMK